MNDKIKNIAKKIVHSPIEPVFFFLHSVKNNIQHFFFSTKWKLTKPYNPTKEELEQVRKNVTFIYKSFERQKLAKKLYRSIQQYYPGTRVIIADDSKKPLCIKDEFATVINLPFNSGLSKGLNEALKLADTPFTVRLDDDHRISPYTNIYNHICFLADNSNVDLVSFPAYNATAPISPQKLNSSYFSKDMSKAPKPLIIPHGTFLDKNHVVLGKTPNAFVARTDKLRMIGYDDNIRMIDHNEFFFRAAGNIVSAMSLNSYVLHYNNPFSKNYRKYRNDYQADLAYIKKKHAIKNK